MRRIFGAALALAMIVSMALIASAETGSVEVRGHIVGTNEPVPQYHITYHANGGSGSYDGPDVTAGGTDTVRFPYIIGITRYGYRFTGWNAREDGRGISYAAGDRITMNSDVTLYAQWRKMAEGGIDGTSPSGNDWTMLDDGAATVEDGTTTIDAGAVPAEDGAATSSSGTASISPTTGAISNMALYVSLLCVSLAVILFLLWANRRGKTA